MRRLLASILIGSASFLAHAQPPAITHMLEGVAGGVDVLSGKRFDLGKELRLPAKASVILELEPAR
ncbi:MAG: cyclomaltodextrinase C-terminal domain-containing protein [Telluria sp.]